MFTSIVAEISCASAFALNDTIHVFFRKKANCNVDMECVCMFTLPVLPPLLLLVSRHGGYDCQNGTGSRMLRVASTIRNTGGELIVRVGAEVQTINMII